MATSPTTGSAARTVTAPPQSLEQRAFLALARTAACLEHRMEEGLRPYGLTLTQFNALRILRGAGAAGLCRNALRDRMIRQVPDVTRLLDRLEGAGLVERCREGEDRRYVTARITDRGLELLARIDEPLLRMHREQLGHLAESELRELAGLLERARQPGGGPE